MAVTAADARTVDELLSAIGAGGQPKYLAFWGHQPPPGGGVGKGCLSQWWPSAFTVDGEAYASAEHFMMAGKALPEHWPGLNLLGFALMEVRRQLRPATA
jgi:predicted NAD-dependent protein-ADP-ribosyltransferase YbiA (DUF1768 family)